MQILSTNNLNNNVSFGGLKQEKILAENILRDYKSVFPYIKSNSFVNTKILEHYKSPKYKDLIDELRLLSARYTSNISLMRQTLRQHKKLDSFSQFTSILKSVFLDKGYANCGELNYILQNQFLKKNINAHMVCMLTFSQKSADRVFGKDHSFVVFNLNKNAKLDNPSTWGSKAIIADAWCNIVMKANDALNYYKNLFSYNAKDEFLVFLSADKIKLADKIS